MRSPCWPAQAQVKVRRAGFLHREQWLDLGAWGRTDRGLRLSSLRICSERLDSLHPSLRLISVMCETGDLNTVSTEGLL